MIDYHPGKWGTAVLWRIKGTVFHKGLVWGVPCACLAVILNIYAPDLVDVTGINFVWGSYTTVLGFLIVFKNNQAYDRFWNGAALVQQIRGEWLNGISSLIAFCNQDKAKRAQVVAFQHLLVRLMSMMHCAALQQISQVEEDAFEIILPVGIEETKLRFLAKNYNDRCEILLQWIQRLIVEHEASGSLKIAPPILSRVYQELSRGIVNLHNVRRIKEIPVPFPYAQLIMLMMITHTVSTGILTSQVASDPILAGILSLSVSTGFWCMFYIALELEHPFGTDMNDLPIHEMQKEMNKSLRLLLMNEVQMPPAFKYDEEVHDQVGVCSSSAKNMTAPTAGAQIGTFKDLPQNSLVIADEDAPGIAANAGVQPDPPPLQKPYALEPAAAQLPKPSDRVDAASIQLPALPAGGQEELQSKGNAPARPPESASTASIVSSERKPEDLSASSRQGLAGQQGGGPLPEGFAGPHGSPDRPPDSNSTVKKEVAGAPPKDDGKEPAMFCI